MFTFRPINSADIETVKQILSSSSNESCDFSAGNLLMWGSFYDLNYCIADGFLITRIKKGDSYYYSFPFGKGDPCAIINKLEEYTDGKLRLYSLTASQLCFMKSYYDGRFSVKSSEYGCEYIYKASSLATLPGRKYHQKKNFINRFYKNHINIHTKRVCSSADIDVCRDITEKWFSDKYGDSFYDETEYKAISVAFEEFFRLGFCGMILYCDDMPVAFSLGDAINSQIFVTHFEKTLPDFRDAYPVINKEFASSLTDYLYINREDDAGEENLRKAKLSYHPDKLLYKYDVVFGNALSVEEKNSSKKKLWKEAFNDEDYIIDAFFENALAVSESFDLYIDGECAAAFYLLPCHFKKDNESFSGYYLYAAATNEKFRKRGIMTDLISTAVDFSRKKDFLVLYAADKKLSQYYIRLGFDKEIYLSCDKRILSDNMTVEEYFRYVDESGFLCYPKEVYRYYKYFSENTEQYPDGCGLGMIFNENISNDDIILKDCL